MSNMPNRLPDQAVAAIKEFLSEKSDILQPEKKHTPIGSSIFDILEKSCTVIYYPIEDVEEENDAFLFSGIPLRTGKTLSFVAINTFQTEEKQVFAAAHELGHILGVEEYVGKICHGIEIDKELIVNRFAAELLMPESEFKDFFAKTISKRPKDERENAYKLDSFLDAIAETMDRFSVPYNSVVIRLVETKMISKQTGILLVDGSKDLPIEDIKNRVKRVISEKPYRNLNNRSMRCEIKGLPELLDKAEQHDDIDEDKIQRLREAFHLSKGQNERLDSVEIVMNALDKGNK